MFIEYNLKFSGEHEAMYFSNFRNYLKSDVAHTIIFDFQELDALKLLHEMNSIC